MLGPLHSEAQRDTLEEQVSATLAAGGELLAGGRRPDGDGLDAGWFYEPTLILEPPHDSKVAVEEVFGPALPIWKVRGLDEAMFRGSSVAIARSVTPWTHVARAWTRRRQTSRGSGPGKQRSPATKSFS